MSNKYFVGLLRLLIIFYFLLSLFTPAPTEYDCEPASPTMSVAHIVEFVVATYALKVLNKSGREDGEGARGSSYGASLKRRKGNSA